MLSWSRPPRVGLSCFPFESSAGREERRRPSSRFRCWISNLIRRRNAVGSLWFCGGRERGCRHGGGVGGKKNCLVSQHGSVITRGIRRRCVGQPGPWRGLPSARVIASALRSPPPPASLPRALMMTHRCTSCNGFIMLLLRHFLVTIPLAVRAGGFGVVNFGMLSLLSGRRQVY